MCNKRILIELPSHTRSSVVKDGLSAEAKKRGITPKTLILLGLETFLKALQSGKAKVGVSVEEDVA